MKEGYTLVVSYSNEGNQPDENAQQWIEHFCNYLQIFVNRLSSHQLSVVKSEELKDPSGNIIAIAVVSPSYLKSDKKLKELNDHSQANHPIYHVQRAPIDKKALPPVLKQELSYNFYEKGENSDNEFVLYDTSTYNKNYWLKLIDLAYDIVHSINYAAHQKSKSEGKNIYLAETTFDQESNRDILKRELQRYGHTILPDHPLPDDPKKLEQDISAYLEKCDLSIHIVGAHYGTVVEDMDDSLVGFQNKIAGKVAEERFAKEKRMLKRFIWSSPGLRPADERQMLYLDQLKEETDKSTNAEIVQVPLEILKSIIAKALQSTSPSRSESGTPRETNGSAVYLVFDQPDEIDIAPLISKLEGEKFEVLTPAFEGDQINLISTHRSNLVESDAVLIYANRSNNYWLSSKINDLIKSPGFGRSKPFLAKAICAPKHRYDKLTEASGSNDLMKLENLNTESINSFLGKLK